MLDRASDDAIHRWTVVSPIVPAIDLLRRHLRQRRKEIDARDAGTQRLHGAPPIPGVAAKVAKVVRLGQEREHEPAAARAGVVAHRLEDLA